MTKFEAMRPRRELLPLQMGAGDIEAWLLAKNPIASGAWNELGKDEYVRSFTAAQTAGTDIADDLYFGMVDTISRNGTEEDFAKLVTPILKQKGWLGGDDGAIAKRVALIYDTNLRLARASGRWDRYWSTRSAFPYLRAIDVGDSRVRHPPKSPKSDHRAWGGIILPIEHPFWRRWWTPLGFRCFLPQTRIEGAVKAGIRRWHEGKAVEVIMSSGRRLSVTSDHAILTGRGWVLAKHIRVGDDAISRRRIVDGAPLQAVDENNLPPRADDLFNAVEAVAFAAGETSPFQFDDEIGGGKGKIDIAFADPILAQELRSKLISEDFLIGAALGANLSSRSLGSIEDGAWKTYASHAGEAPNLRLANTEGGGDSIHGPLIVGSKFTESGLNFSVPIAAHLPRHPALPLHATRRLFDGLPLDRFRLGSPAQDDALFDELATYTSAADHGLFSELLEAHSALVERDIVVNVREFNFSGHVYDFQTDEGIVLADDVVAHNCRCTVVQMTRSQLARYKGGITSEDDLADRERRLGEPVFPSPALPMAVRMEAAVSPSNQEPMPGRPPIDAQQAARQGSEMWDAVIRAGILDDVSETLAKLFGL